MSNANGSSVMDAPDSAGYWWTELCDDPSHWEVVCVFFADDRWQYGMIGTTAVYLCREHDKWVRIYHPNIQAEARSQDSERLDWLEAHPLKAEVRGGSEDGHQSTAWAVAASNATLRETLDVLRSHKASNEPS
jgi:hypothetical protein